MIIVIIRISIRITISMNIVVSICSIIALTPDNRDECASASQAFCMEGLLPLLTQGLSFIQWGSAHSWFGLACPAHCQNSVLVLTFVFCSGLGSGFVLCLWTFRFYILRPLGPETPCPPEPVSGRPAPHHFRLRAYALNEPRPQSGHH